MWNCAGRQNVRLHVRNNVYSYHFGGFCVFQLVNRVNFNFMYSIGVSRNGKTQIIVTPFLFVALLKRLGISKFGAGGLEIGHWQI